MKVGSTPLCKFVFPDCLLRLLIVFSAFSAREKRRKREERERLEAELEKLKAKEEERSSLSGPKVSEWMQKKKIEAEKKMLQLAESRKAMIAANSKPKEFKKAINYNDWLAKKNERVVLKRKEDEEKQNATKNNHIRRKYQSSVSLDDWMRSASSKAKPVPMSKGLDSLRGSTTKIYLNPEPWKFDV